MLIYINSEKITEQYQYVKISGGILILSFGFRDMSKICESIHCIFLHRSIFELGTDISIINLNKTFRRDEKNLAINIIEEVIDKIIIRIQLKSFLRFAKPICKRVNRSRKEFNSDDLKMNMTSR